MTALSERQIEVQDKLGRLRSVMTQRQIEATLLNLTANVAWITAGASTFINEATNTGPCTILVTQDRAAVLTDTIEAPRLQQDEQLTTLGFELIADPWVEGGKSLNALTKGKTVGHDGTGAGVDLSVDLRDLRSVLIPQEVTRFRQVGAIASEVVEEAARSVRPGDSEYHLAALLASKSRERGGQSVVNLIASDERIEQFRHPLPTAKTVRQYAMLVLCYRMGGLIASVTRLVYFGKLPDAIREKAMVVSRVNAKMIVNTVPGRSLGEIYEIAKQAYAAEGYAEAITQHHQGGSAAYMPREILATPAEKAVVRAPQVFAWNPSVRGAKVEDTVLVHEKGFDILTQSGLWPVWEIQSDGKTVPCAAILEM